MMAVIVISVMPLAFKQQTTIFSLIDKISAVIFILDYFLRLITADYKMDKGTASFFLYPFTFMAIIDIISILPSISLLNSAFRLLRIFRLIRTLRIFRIFKAMRYSKSISLFYNVFRKQKDPLSTVLLLSLSYILISALLIFNVEPQTFDTYYDAIYWATVSLTTMGYGDIYPVTNIGRAITMLSSIVGIAIVALPAGIITAGFMDELYKK